MRPRTIRALTWKTLLSGAAGLALSVSPAVAQWPPAQSVYGSNELYSVTPTSVAEPTTPETPQTPQVPQTQTENAATTPEQNLGQQPSGFEEQTGAGAGMGGINMIGDLLYGPRSVSLPLLRVGGATNVLTSLSSSVTNPNIAENNNPLPQDRVFFRFNYFHDSASVTGLGAIASTSFPDQPLIQQARSRDYDENLYTFGGEMTFWDKQASVELRIPFRTTLASKNDLVPAVPATPSAFTSSSGVRSEADAFGGLYYALFETIPTPEQTFGHEDTEWDNLSIILKGLLYRDHTLAISAGLGITWPTAQDARVSAIDYYGPIGRVSGVSSPPISIPLVSGERYRQVLVRNDMVGLTPFIAAQLQPSTRWFVQGFLSVDVPTNKSEVVYDDRTVFGPPVVTTQHDTVRVADQTLLKADVGTGYWIYREPTASTLTGIVPSIELHYTTTLDNAGVYTFPQDQNLFAFLTVPAAAPTPSQGPTVGNQRNRMDILDMTVGTTFVFGKNFTMAHGFAFPLHTGDNRVFDWEYLLELNYYFGARR